MRLGRDRAVAHRARGEPLHDGADRFDLLERDGCPGLEVEQSAQGHQAFGLLVHQGAVLPEDVVPSGAGGVLEPEDRLRIEHVGLALAPPLILAPDAQGAVRGRDAGRRVGRRVPELHLARDDVEAHPTQRGGGAGEVLVDQLLGESDRLEHLGTPVGHDRGDPHLRHHLQHALAERLDEVLDGLLLGHVHDALVHQPLHGLHREVGVDRGGAVPDEEGDVMDLADIARLDHERDPGAGASPQGVVVHRRGEQQGRNRCELRVRVPVRQDDEAHAGLDGGVDLREDLLET